MNRFLSCTALGLVLGLSPALAQDQPPADEAQTPPAIEQPSQIPEVTPSEPAEPSDPAAPIPGDSSEMSPQISPAAPGEASPPPQSSEAPQPPAAPGEASPPPQSSEAPPITPAAPSASAAGSPQFLTKQESGDVLA
ncbi:MAG: hypothetical protein ACRECM_06945, partial [Methyloceanibacter sp.]